MSTHLRPIVPAQLARQYPDILGPRVINALAAVAPLEEERASLMALRLARRERRARTGSRPAFLHPATNIGESGISVQEARDGDFVGAVIPDDLQCQWIQGTGPAARPRASIAQSLRSVAYALLSGADGWMFDGEDALGQLSIMGLESQRALKLAIHSDPQFLEVADEVAREMNDWSRRVLDRDIVLDTAGQLRLTTKIFRPRGLHLDDRHVMSEHGEGFSASIVDSVLYLVNNHARLRTEGSSLVLYLPKIQTADEADFWDRLLTALEEHIGLPCGSVRTYVLVEQLEASFQLMEIRAALRARFVGFNTGRWDYIHSVVDAMAFDPSFIHPDISAVTMTYGYMREYEDRVRRAANTPDRKGRFVLWQGGMEPNIPVGSEKSVASGIARARAGAERECEAGASGKWVAHWKMVPFIRPIWERHGRRNQLGRAFPRLGYTQADAAALYALDPGPRTEQGTRALISVGLQYGNAFGQGLQAAALKPADDFADESVLYLMEDMATAEIRLAILWEWLHKGALVSTGSALETDRVLNREWFDRLLLEEYKKLQSAEGRNVHEASKSTTLPLSRLAMEAYVQQGQKLPWYIDLLNVILDVDDVVTAEKRVAHFVETFLSGRLRITKNLNLSNGAVSALL